MPDMIPAWVDGVLTPVEKLDAHRRALQHKAVSVFALDGDRVLIQQRALGKYHTPGLWANTCCTHPLWDEAPRDCAIRRLEQELGITGVDPEYRHQVSYRADVGGGLVENEVVDIFVVANAGQVDVSPNPEEVMAVEWITLADLIQRTEDQPDAFTPWLKIYLQDHLPHIFAGNIPA